MGKSHGENMGEDALIVEKSGVGWVCSRARCGSPGCIGVGSPACGADPYGNGAGLCDCQVGYAGDMEVQVALNALDMVSLSHVGSFWQGVIWVALGLSGLSGLHFWQGVIWVVTADCGAAGVGTTGSGGVAMASGRTGSSVGFCGGGVG